MLIQRSEVHKDFEFQIENVYTQVMSHLRNEPFNAQSVCRLHQHRQNYSDSTALRIEEDSILRDPNNCRDNV